MNNLLRLIVVGGLAALAIVSIALGMVRNVGALSAPAHLLVFVLAVVFYLLPIGVALYRDCKATVWITVLDVLLGWTMFGWFVALGWAASGRTRGLPPVMSPPQIHPIPGH
jgi:hypothetical protein